MTKMTKMTKSVPFSIIARMSSAIDRAQLRIIGGGVMAGARVDELAITVQGDLPADDKTWRENLEAQAELARKHGLQTGILVWTLKHGPSARQRQLLAGEFNWSIAQQRRLAIITESVVLRGTATAVGWFSGGGMKTRGFIPRELDEAFDWLGEECRFDRDQARAMLDAAIDAVHLAPQRASSS
jgi:hypothetical protein